MQWNAISQQMGFDLYIHLKLMMCPQTGSPYYFGPNLTKMYGVPTFVIPEHLRPYLQGRGHHFFAYLRFLEYSEREEVDLVEFLENYPEWKDVQTDDSYDEDWTQEDHNKFASLLEYLHALGYPFSIGWSY